MSLAYLIVGIVLALMLLVSARAKLTRNQQLVDGLTGLGVPLKMFPFLAACEIAGAVGLVIGIWWAPLGIAAAIGVVLYFVGAVGTHLRRSDFKGAPNAAVMLLLAVAVLILRVLSA
ncbi:DoxX family protein [Streptomyces sp. NBC_01433]|uniref:DoxX family protein n=1 Tax=Streptomyces sp. NBC_01433 TaxID=2903864 RepID=UPI00224CA038|nr:DoxX family protein [Streptomyces sp. NBC_01433]MCX4676088.1 DoxX family protein [Streptomyces sp. NBC_01433]